MPEPLHLGIHLSFVREGGGVTKTARPADGAYGDLGSVGSYTVDTGEEIREIIGPKTGGGLLVRKDALVKQRAPVFTARLLEVGPLFWELTFGTAALSAGATTIAPGAKTTVRGWLKVKAYDHTNTAKATYIDVFALVQVQNISMGGDGVEWELRILEIESAAAAGTLANLS